MHALVIEASDSVKEILEALVKTGLWGPTAETAAQRLLEIKLFEVLQYVSKQQHQ